MKLRLFLVFVLIYISAVFGWWLYSFIMYTEKEFALENDNLKLNAEVIQFRISEYIDFCKQDKHEEPYITYLRMKPEIDSMHRALNAMYGVKSELGIRENAGSLYELLDVQISPVEFSKIRKTFITKQRAFYSEVIFFTLLVISGVVWVFGKLESLLKLNKMQNNFLLSVTHEFKTPITAIKLSSQTLQRRVTDQGTREQLVQQMVNNADRLNELLDNVLLANRIDARSYRYEMRRTDIGRIIRETAEQVLAEPHFTGVFEFDESSEFINGDELSLKLVFSNLFQNAVKYAGASCKIRVSFVRDEKYLQVQVSDNGKGLEASEYKAIFNKFYRVGDEDTRETEGTGLGLFLVKQILKSHRADIKAYRNEPQGTTFNITFKRTKV